MKRIYLMLSGFLLCSSYLFAQHIARPDHSAQTPEKEGKTFRVNFINPPAAGEKVFVYAVLVKPGAPESDFCKSDKFINGLDIPEGSSVPYDIPIETVLI